MSAWQKVSNKVLEDVWRAQMPGAPLPDCFQHKTKPLAAIVAREPLGEYDDPDLRWHISVTHESRVPSWEEMAATAHDLRPGVGFVIGIPPKSWWLNVHPNCLHLWETADQNMIAEWRRNAMGHRPT